MTHNQQSLFDAVPVAPAQPVTSASAPVPADEVPMDAYADYAAYEEQPALEVPADYVPAPSPEPAYVPAPAPARPALDLDGLNPAQREAVECTHGPLLVLAGAGSGKTRVLTMRIAHMIADEGVRPWQVLAITFTNKAAAEMRERLSALLPGGTRGMWVCTFHAMCVRMLREDPEAIGYAPNFTIYDDDDSKRLVKSIMNDLGIDQKQFPINGIRSKISSAKNAMVGPGELESSTNPADRAAGRVYRALDARLAKANAMDFDDLLVKTYELLSKNPGILEGYQDRFLQISVDEYQDTNHVQYAITNLLAAKFRNLMVVGDDDQSIYSWRGADIQNILDFEKDYPDARTVRLEQNYRSTQHILDAANAVIKNNEGRKGKTLWTDNGSGDVVTVKTNFNEGDEANFVAGDILMGVNRGRNFRDTAILYRMNAQSNALEYALKRNAIPYKVVGGMKFFDRAEVKDMLAYLCVLNNPMDDLRLRRIINTPTRGIGATTMDKVAELAAEQGASLYEIIRNADLFPTLKTAAGKLTKFADLIDGLRRAGGTLALPEFYDEVLNQTGYVRALEEKKDMESRGRIENVQELKSNILGFLEQDPEDATLSGFLNEIALYTDLDSVEVDDNCVTMMTIHSAKGLEFPVVYVVGMEEGIFPGAAAMYDEEELEEERRLCYVAMTRAREKLVMTNARQRMLYGRTSANKSSRFLDEIPAEDMRWESKPEPKFGTYDEDGFGGSRWGDDFGGGSFGGSSYSGSSGRSGGYVSGGVHTYKSTKPAAQTLRTSSRGSTPAAPSVGLIQLSQGDQVEHTAFGKGSVVSVKPMGGDALAEVAFETGTKKLMLKAAGKHLKKL